MCKEKWYKHQHLTHLELLKGRKKEQLIRGLEEDAKVIDQLWEAPFSSSSNTTIYVAIAF